jgi:hypothetical protein
MSKLTIRDLAKHVNKSEAALYNMRRDFPELFHLLWLGWKMKHLMEDYHASRL